MPCATFAGYSCVFFVLCAVFDKANGQAATVDDPINGTDPNYGNAVYMDAMQRGAYNGSRLNVTANFTTLQDQQQSFSPSPAPGPGAGPPLPTSPAPAPGFGQEGTPPAFGPGPAPGQGIEASGRRLLQSNVNQINNRNSVYFCDIKYGGAAPGTQTSTIRPDTGSGSLIIETGGPPGSFSTNDFQADQPPTVYEFRYGDIAGTFSTDRGTKYTQGFSFAQDRKTSVASQTAYLVLQKNNARGTLGMNFRPNEFSSTPKATETTVISNLINSGAIPNPYFTVSFTSVPSSVAVGNNDIPGGSIILGGLDPAQTGKDVSCASLTSDSWTVGLDQVLAEGPATSNPPSSCGVGQNCRVLFDTGNLYTSLPNPAYTDINTWLGADLNDQVFGESGPPVIPCSRIAFLLANNYRVSFIIAGRLYTQDANTYINRYAAGVARFQNGQRRPTETCATIFTGPGARYILGDNWLAAYPSTFIVPPNSVRTARAPGAICMAGTVRIQAQCKPRVQIQATIGAECKARISQADLISQISLVLPGQTAGFSQTLSPAPPAPAGSPYLLPQGFNNFRLTVSNSVGTDSCTSTVDVYNLPPTIGCRRQIVVPATSQCRSQVTTQQLVDQIVTGSSQGTGGALAYSVSPSIAGGIPLGSQTVQITATNCAGVAVCNAVVEVQDQEALNAASGSCGNTPADGVLKPTLPQKLSDNVIATYTSAYTKQNGCPTSTLVKNLQCKNCFLGEAKEKECNSRATADRVEITGKQEARVTWDAVTTDASSTVTKKCAVCVDDPLLGKCPRPFDAATACVLGKY